LFKLDARDLTIPFARLQVPHVSILRPGRL